MSNAYEQLVSVRDMIGEETSAQWKDRELLKRLNFSQRRLAQVVSKSAGSWLIKNVPVTPSSSEITWPSDCSKPVYLEETTSGRPIPFSTHVKDRRVSRMTGTTLYLEAVEAYFERGKIVVNQDSYSTACTLWYQIRVPDLHVGTASAGGAASLTLSAHDGAGISSGGFGARMIADYYNSVGIQVVSGTGAGAPDTITDYSAARVATVTGTYDSDSVYGTISMLPEECWDLMVLETVLAAMTKPSSTVDQQIFGFIRDRWTEANRDFKDWISTQSVGSHRVRVTELE